jgi:hypothetical protein
MFVARDKRADKNVAIEKQESEFRRNFAARRAPLAGLHLARQRACMPPTRSCLAAAIAGLLLQPAAARADERAPNLRPDAGLRRLVAEAAERSPSIRASIERLEALDVIVYVRTRMFYRLDLEGRVGFIAAAGARRIIAIELACGRPEVGTMATLAHELYHAIEIAEEPSIVDTRTLAAFYRQHGTEASDGDGRLMFDTRGADEAGRRARQELIASSTRHSTWMSK